MPRSISTLITTRDLTSANRLQDIIPILSLLVASDPDVESARLCTESTDHIFHLSGEGQHFCAYRNMQMLLSSRYRHTDKHISDVPNVLDLQRQIEHAWDAGINTHGRIETGGIAGTRKHVGPSEVRGFVDALLLFLDTAHPRPLLLGSLASCLCLPAPC